MSSERSPPGASPQSPSVPPDSKGNATTGANPDPDFTPRLASSPPSTPTSEAHRPQGAKVTLPTPPSFSAHRARTRTATPASPESPNAHSEERLPARKIHLPGQGHGCTVSFADLDLGAVGGGDGNPEHDSPRVYRIPQRQSSVDGYGGGRLKPPFELGGTSTSMDGAAGGRKPPPRPLSLVSRFAEQGPFTGVSPLTKSGSSVPTASEPFNDTNSPLRRSVASATSSAFAYPPKSAPASRFASRGPSISPSLVRGAGPRTSTGGIGGLGSFSSIWSAGLPAGARGWISPALGSARSMGTGIAARTRGLTVAVLNDGKEMICESLPTPGLGAGPGAGGGQPVKSPIVSDSSGSGETVAPNMSERESAGAAKRKEGLTCTSRPCRFVHNLDAISATLSAVPSRSIDRAQLRLLSPMPMAARSADPTTGTFAAAQAAAALAGTGMGTGVGAGPRVKDIAGETVVVEDEQGKEVVGTVFLMSGGGKGPAGKSKAKLKTVPCKDFAEGYCAYGDYCSFLHDERKEESVVVHAGEEDAPSKEKVEDAAAAAAADGLHRLDRGPTLTRRALDTWTKSLPKAELVPSVMRGLDRAGPEKQKDKLSAFAPPFLGGPVVVDATGSLKDAAVRRTAVGMRIPGGLKDTSARRASGRMVSPSILVHKRVERTVEVEHRRVAATYKAQEEPAVASEGGLKASAWAKPLELKKAEQDGIGQAPNVDEEPTVTVAKKPKVSAWARPLTLKKVTIVENPSAPLSAALVPISATSVFGTESDPCTPWDPALHARKIAVTEAEAEAEAHDQAQARNANQFDGGFYAHVSLNENEHEEYAYQYQYHDQHPYLLPLVAYPGMSEYAPPGFASPSYPWGMPMSPVAQPGYGGEVPTFPGGPGVMWTPAGWAVQDAAMKSALRSAEVRLRYADAKRRAPKTSYRTRPCKFFAEGVCPHGEHCTYLHELPSDSSDSNSPAPARAQHPRHRTQPCKFFNSAMGCTNGEACAFLHTRVVPAGEPLVLFPRSWRTRPCRHFLVGRCTLGEACHFAHVLEGTHGSDGGAGLHDGGGRAGAGGLEMIGGNGGGGEGEGLTEERLAKATEQMRGLEVKGPVEEDEESDDLEIVTDTSRMSPARSMLAI